MKKKKSTGKGRIIALIVLCLLVFALFFARLIYMQFICAEEYHHKVAEASSGRYTSVVPAARGDITDRNGAPLAQDTPAWDVYLRWPAPPGRDAQEVFLQTVPILEAAGSGDVETQPAAFFDFCASVAAGEYRLAHSVSAGAAGAVFAAGLTVDGAVRLVPRGVRSWPCTDLLPQLLGSVGPITQSQWQAEGHALAEAGYAMDDTMGQSGLEAAFESDLRGHDGAVSVQVGRNGKLRSSLQTAPAIAGNTLQLTIDAGLQRALQDALEAQIANLRATKPQGKGKEACAGAAVVVDTATGGILAAASLPGYTLPQLRGSYAALVADARAPLFNRICNGLYAPGSAFKPAVAVAALQQGLITPQSIVRCTGHYTYYSGYQPGCLQLGHGGAVDLLTALRQSCNIYFYDVGRRLGVDAFSATARSLGLGADPGLELPTAAGRLTFTTDANYQEGLTLQAAIGQGNTAVTPLQLAAYACTLANNGKRPRLHLVQGVRDGVTGEVLRQSDTAPQMLGQVSGGEAVFGPVREGMRQMAATLRVLRESPVPLAAKTGSPQRAQTYDGTPYTDSVLIGYAPADAPQIALAVVIEYGGGGAAAAPVLRKIVDAYFAG